MPLSNYPHGFNNGVTIREFPILELQNGLSNVFWVDSNKGSNGNKGSFAYPFATLDYAIGRCTASQGDKIFVAAGHAEALIASGSVTADVAGIQIIGLGTGGNRPTFTASTATAASFNVSAANVYISGLRFVCNIASQTSMMGLEAANIVIDGCYFTEGTATGLKFIGATGSPANTSDGVKILNCEFNAPTAGNYVEAINLGQVADGIVIKGCVVYGDFDTACIHNPTGKVLTNLTVADCVLTNLLTGQHALELVSACTGIAKNLYMYTDTYATTIDPGALKCFEVYSVSAVDKNARLNPVVES